MTFAAVHRSADPPPDPLRLRALPDAAPTDAQLVARSVDEPAEFAALFDRHAGAVHRYLGRRVGDLADDLLSETFLVAFRRRAAYRAEHLEVRPWLLGIATNVLRGHERSERRRYRALAREAGRPEEHADDPADAGDRLAAQALRGPLAAALAGLKPRDRDALLLLAWGQLGYGEIAAVLDVPVGTVRSRLHRARRQTRAALGDVSPFDPTSEEDDR
ncbi:RNA polymerase sigma factor [Blastococcus goldschmidtiae]|uniref:RNA polymerase sigma factor n=1 Tax=Blastococcus goldschmidtiae TaxID=3075546 RepID=A0ABU2K1Y5_9ACTN|nr:RNA polymerase sigma factor [Blastococcus sp. DSM 46792]MDT0274366.1 RNA polymerase sigma factor [Blastococcus sp. DSM 46792]